MSISFWRNFSGFRVIPPHAAFTWDFEQRMAFLLMRGHGIEEVLHMRRNGFSLFNEKVFARFFLVKQ